MEIFRQKLNLEFSSLANYVSPHRAPHPFSKPLDQTIKIEDFKSQNFPTLQWIGTKLEVEPGFVFKKANFQSFSWTRKTWEVPLEQNFKIPKCLCELELTWKSCLRPTLKNPNLWIYEWIDKKYILI